MTGIKIIKIFLASSSELKSDREQFEIFINRKNKEYIKQSVFLELVIWEDFLDAMSATRLQDEYNKAITGCDVFVSLFKTKVGRYTEEEFTQAFQTFKDNKKPLIYTYFQQFQITSDQVNINDLMSLQNFQGKLSQLGHYHTKYKNVDDLKYRFGEQLIKLKQRLADNLLEIPISNKSQLDELEKLKQKLIDIERLHSNKLVEIKSTSRQEKKELEQNIQLLQSQKEQLEQQLEEERSQQQQLEKSYQSQIEKKESEIIRLQNSAKSQQERIDELTKELEDKEQSRQRQLEAIKTTSREEKEKLKQSFRYQISQLEQQLEQEKSCFNKQQAELQATLAKIAEKEAVTVQLQEEIKQLKYEPKTIIEQEIELKSAKGVDYTKLRDLLAAGEWKKADQETANTMLKIANQRNAKRLTSKDIDNFPCEDLSTINHLWLHYSEGKFGFKVQKEIYESFGGTADYDGAVWDSFGDCIGWRKEGRWLPLSELSYKLTAPKGNLPIVWGNFPENNTITHLNLFIITMNKTRQSLFSRIQACNL